MNISRRNFMAGGAVAAGMLPLNKYKLPTSKHPNILFIFPDMQRARSLGCYGDSNARTPNLDAFSQQGIRTFPIF